MDPGLDTATRATTTADEAAAKAKQNLADLQERLSGKAKITVADQQALRKAQDAVVDTTAKATDAHKKLGQAQIDAGKASTGQADNMTALSQKLSGQASAAADSFSGKISAVKARVEDAAAAFGQKYGPSITVVGAAMTGVGAAIETGTAILSKFKSASEAGAAATDGLKVAQEGQAVAAEAAGAAEGLALGPIILIIAAVALLGLGIYELVKHWSTVWATMSAVIGAVWNWIKTNWPLLTAILLGPVAIAALEIYRHWDQIKAGAMAAFNWVKDHWPLLLAILTGPVGLAVLEITRHWDGLVGFFGGLPGRIASAARGMFDGVWEAFRSAINHIIDGWNRLRFGIPEIDTHIPGVGKVGGGDFGVPQIPRLAAGGLITADGLIYAHAGEAITPAPGRTGPAVVINDAHFASELDVEAFMKKAAWVVQTAGL